MSPFLVTGVAGFIGFHLAKRLLKEGFSIVGIDMVNDYYSVTLKEDRLKILNQYPHFEFYRFNLMDKEQLLNLFKKYQFLEVVHLAAQAGVRHSLTHPQDYIDFNLTVFLNILEACRSSQVKHLLYASSSSVYGASEQLPFSVNNPVDHPVSLYAASKRANELMAHAYSWNYQIPTTGLRFFSAYGAYGRPDMALFIFMQKMLKGEAIQVYNDGNMLRDFTYIDDIVESIVRLLPKPAKPNAQWDPTHPAIASSPGPYQLFNVGNNAPVPLMAFIRAIEEELDIEANIEYQPIQPGDVPRSYADAEDLYNYIQFKPQTSVRQGIKEFVSWYRTYFKV